MKLGITMLIQNKDDIEFVTEFKCFLGHPVGSLHVSKEKYNLETLISRSNVTNFRCKENLLDPSLQVA